MRRLHRDERGQSLAIVLALITVLFLMGTALAAHISVALKTTVSNEAQAGDLHAADAGAELGMWWQRNGNAGNPPPLTGANQVNGLDVNVTVGVAGGTPCPAPSTVALTGFEHGAVSLVGGGLFSDVNVGTGGTVSADSAVPRTGSYSLKIADPGAGANNADLDIGTGVGIAVVRIYLRLAPLPAANVTELLVLDMAAGNDLRLGYQASSQKLTLLFVNQPMVVASSTISPGSFYRIDLRLDATVNPRTADWQINGVAQPGISRAQAATTVNTLRLGSAVAPDAFTANYDDVLMSDASSDYPLGPGAVVGLRPDGMGTSSTPGAFLEDDLSAIDANSYGRLVDSPMTSLTDYLLQQTVGANDYLEVNFADTSTTCVVGVSGLLAYHAAGTQADNGTTRIFDGSTATVVFSGDMSQTPLQYKSQVVAPASAPWTPSAVNGLRARIGYSSDAVAIPYWDGLLLEVATGIYFPGTVTVISTAGSSTITTTYTDVGSSSPTLLTWSTTR